MTSKYRSERISQIIKNIKIKASGRTRYEGQAAFTDEELVAYIESLEELLDEKNQFIQRLIPDSAIATRI